MLQGSCCVAAYIDCTLDLEGYYTKHLPQGFCHVAAETNRTLDLDGHCTWQTLNVHAHDTAWATQITHPHWVLPTDPCCPAAWLLHLTFAHASPLQQLEDTLAAWNDEKQTRRC